MRLESAADEGKLSLEDIMRVVTDIRDKQLIESITSENKELKKVRALEGRLENIEQYSRSNCEEIQGIPVTSNEDVLTIVKDVGKALDLTVSDTMVDACHRLGAKQSGNNPPGIIVKSIRRLDKEKFLRRRRVKRTLSTRHIGATDDRPIYVNESLSPARRALYALARKYQREKNFNFLHNPS
ncbi:uncharacterized protein LOC124371454 [Homalodisca vitripennis]|uniref:uncharacterized protein LOC124371454 n=1 Tax=Homalodisca vitripennis TaxID=197043 RepID=UPI001EEC118B|nr:uncharacterized protein LOC124371454 [Homalodisca vitripennis]